MRDVLERVVKDKAKKTLKNMGAYYFMPVTGGFGRSGVLDICACLRGEFIGIECKADDITKMSVLQVAEFVKIREAGGRAFLINANNVDQLEELICGSTKKRL